MALTVSYPDDAKTTRSPSKLNETRLNLTSVNICQVLKVSFEHLGIGKHC